MGVYEDLLQGKAKLSLVGLGDVGMPEMRSVYTVWSLPRKMILRTWMPWLSPQLMRLSED